MSISDFLSNQNVKLIWEVLIDEDVLKNKANDVFQHTNKMIVQTIELFYEKEKQTVTNLTELNKKFITYIIHYLNKNFNNKPQVKKQEREKEKELITFEEIQSNRLSDFDKQLAKRQQEFTNAITLQVPEVPNFSDNIDKPLDEMELEVKKMMAQRNYDVEQITKSLTGEKAENWLKPRETSIKNEKISISANTNTNINTTNTNKNNTEESKQIKYIKIDNNDVLNNIYKNDVIDLNNSPRKHISWADENIQMNIHDDYTSQYIDIEAKVNADIDINIDNDIDNNIFKKLKLIPGKVENGPKPQYEEKIIHMETEIQNLHSKVEEINNRLFEMFKILQKK